MSLSTAWRIAQRIACVGSLAGLASSQASAAVYYWDPTTTATPGTTGIGANGLGTTTTTLVAGNWNTSGFWTLTPTSTLAGDYTTWASVPAASDIVFNTGILNINPGTVTLGSATSVNSLNIQGGRWTFAGTGTPTLTIGAGGIALAAAGGGNLSATVGGDTTFNNTLSIVAAGNQTWTNNAGNATNNLVFNSAISGNASSGTNVLTLAGGTLGSGIQLGGAINDGLNGGNLAITVTNTVNALTATGQTTTRLTSASSIYSGKTTVTNGSLTFTSIADVGAGGSSLGSVLTVADGTIDLGSTTNTAGIIYNGTTASSSDRIVNMAGTTGGGVIKNVATAATSTLTLTGGITNAGGGNKTLTLGGTNTGANAISGVIADGSGGSKTAVSKIDVGLWGLNGTNTYTGGTTITAGTLSVGAAGNLGADVVGNNVTINGGNLLLNADTNVGTNQTITITSGGIGVSYLPSAFPTITDSTGATGGVFGLNYVGTGGIGSITSISNLFTGTSNWFLGSFVGGSGTYTGSSLTAGNGSNYRLGGGGGTLTVQNDILTGANNLIVGGTGGGTVNLTNANTYTGTTTVQNGTLNVAVVGSVGAASSSIGAQTNATNAAITLGSTTNAVVLNYTGAGETTDRQLKLVGTTGSVTLGNSGTGNIVFSTAPSITGAGAKTLNLGNGTDVFGGSIGAITDVGANKTTLAKNGLTNSRWILTGGAGNTFTGNTTVNGGVLQTAAIADLATSYVTVSGASTTQYAVWQTQGTLTRTASATAGTGNINVGGNAGFAAKGGTLTVNLGSGTNLVWATGFAGSGGAQLVFGSSTADNQVIFQNNLDFGAATIGFNRQIYVEKGAGGDSALMSGILSASNVGATGNHGLVKNGNGTLILSGANTYSGATLISAGTLIAANNVSNVIGTAGAFGDGHTTGVNAGSITLTLGDGNTTLNNSSASLLTGGAFTIARAVTVANQATTGTYSVGGSTDNNSAFTGAISTNQNLTVSQVATTGGNALTVSGGITGGATASTKTVSFNNTGAVNVTTVGITDGGGGGKLAVAQTGTGVTTFSGANTYTSTTVVSAGTLLINGTHTGAASYSVTGGTLGGSGSITGATNAGITVASGAKLAPGAAASAGTLTVALTGTGVMDISGAVGGANTGGLVFDLGAVNGNSDKFVLTTGALNIGTGSLEFSDFNFSTLTGFADGNIYTLFDTNTAITGSLGSILTGNIGGFNGTLSMANANNDLILTIAAVPEPSTYALVAGGLGFLFVLRRRMKKVV